MQGGLGDRRSNYWVFDNEYDSAVDSYPELGSSGMAVSKAAPDTLKVVGLGSPASDGSVSRDGYVGVLLDSNGDGASDYGSVAPRCFHEYRYDLHNGGVQTSGSSTVNTGLTASCERPTAAGFPWRAMVSRVHASSWG